MAAKKNMIKKARKKSNKAITGKTKNKKKPSKPVARKKAPPKKPPSGTRRARSTSRRSEREPGELQGLSKTELADSESVAELIEEGNTFEAGVVKGVEEAESADGREVHTHEQPEDDVPQEYLDKD